MKDIRAAQHSVLRTSPGKWWKWWNMCVFLEKPLLFADPWCIEQKVLPWKMIAHHHSKVQPT